MSKKVLLIAGVLLAAGSVAAISAPHFRGGHRGGPHGSLFGEMGEGSAQVRLRLGEQLKAMDADGDGAVALEEFLARRAPAFALFDKNSDAVVDAAEFESGAKDSTDYWTRRFMKRFDADHDGKISKEEFSKARRERFAMRDLNDDGRIGLEDTPPGVRDRVGRGRGKDGKDGKEARKDGGFFSLDRLLGRSDRRFGRLDKNSDGAVDATDLQVAAAERIAFASQRFFKRFDADRDGKVTRAEFDRFAKERFANLDLDDDGKITEADLPPLMRGRGLLK